MKTMRSWLAVVLVGAALGCGGKGTVPDIEQTALPQAASARRLYEPLVHPTLLAAVMADDVYDVEQHLLRGENVNAPNAEGLSALHLAAAAGRVYMIEHLVARGANMRQNIEGQVHSPPIVAAAKVGQFEASAALRKLGAPYTLREAAAYGDLGTVREFIETNPRLLHQKSRGTEATSLFSAVQGNQIAVATYMIEQGANTEALDRQGNNALFYAAMFGYEDMVRFLVDKGLHPNSRLWHGDSLIHRLAARGNPHGMIEFLVELGADPNARNGHGIRAMHVATTTNSTRVVERLLDCGAPVDSRTLDEQTPLHLAAAKGLTDMAAFLVEHGAPVSARDKVRQTPLHLASQAGHREVGELLLDSGAEVTEKDKQTYLPIHLAAEAGHLDLVKLFLGRGSEVQAPTRRWRTPLHLAAQAGQLEVVKFLTDQGATVDIKDIDSETPLFLSSLNDHLPVAEFLVAKGADVRSATRSGQTPMFAAARARHPKLVELVLGHGAEVKVTDKRGNTPLHAAADHGCATTVEILLNKGADANAKNRYKVTPLYLAAPRGDLRMIKLLIDHGADVHARNYKGFTAMHAAARQGHWGSVQLLLRKGVDVNIPTEEGFTPVHWSAANGRARLTKLLIDRGADVHARTKDGRTPLHLAEDSVDRVRTAKTSSLDKPGGVTRSERQRIATFEKLAIMLRALVSRDVVNAATNGDMDLLAKLLDIYPDYVDAKKHQRTPLQTGIMTNNKPMIELLILRGADPMLTDVHDRTACELAKDKGFTEMAGLLERYEKAVETVYLADRKEQLAEIKRQKKNPMDSFDHSPEHQRELRMQAAQRLFSGESS